MYALADSTRSRTVRQRLARFHVARARGRAAISSSRRGSRSSPVTTPMRSCVRRRRASVATCADGRGARRRIHAAGVGDDAHAAFGDGRQHALDGADEVARVSHVRVALLLLLQNAHRDFGEIVEHQIVDVAAFDLPARRLEPIAPEALPRCDAYDARRTSRSAHASCVVEVGGKNERPEMRPGILQRGAQRERQHRRACPPDRRWRR